MNKSRFSQYTKILALICGLLSLISCFPTTYIFIDFVVVSAPPATITEIPPNPGLLTPTPGSFEQLKVIWIITRKCTGGRLDNAKVELKISGGSEPYTVSPNSSFSIREGQQIKVAVASQDGQMWNGYIPAPTCKSNTAENPDGGEQSISGEGTGSTPGGGTGSPPTINPTFHPPTP